MERSRLWGSVTLGLHDHMALGEAIAFVVKLIFDASIEAQGGAYATGVLVLMSSAAAVAMTIAVHRRGAWRAAIAFGLIALVFFYTTIVNSILAGPKVTPSNTCCGSFSLVKAMCP